MAIILNIRSTSSPITVSVPKSAEASVMKPADAVKRKIQNLANAYYDIATGVLSKKHSSKLSLLELSPSLLAIPLCGLAYLDKAPLLNGLAIGLASRLWLGSALAGRELTTRGDKNMKELNILVKSLKIDSPTENETLLLEKAQQTHASFEKISSKASSIVNAGSAIRYALTAGSAALALTNLYVAGCSTLGVTNHVTAKYADYNTLFLTAAVVTSLAKGWINQCQSSSLKAAVYDLRDQAKELHKAATK